MSWFKSVKKPHKPSNHPPSLDAAPQIGAGSSSVSAKFDQGVGSKAGSNNGNTSGGDQKSEGRYRQESIRKRATTSANNAKNPTYESLVLKSLFGTVSAIYVHCEGVPPHADKVENLISRIITLEDLLATPPVDTVEQAHRRELTQKLHAIGGRFRLFYREQQPQGLQESEDISELLEDLREAISDHWIAQKTELYSQEHNLIIPGEAAALNSFRCSQGVEFWDGDRRGCLRGTRTAVLDEIELWARDFSRPPVFWLNGLARTGKTVIAQTIAERIFADGHLGASFFCSRNFEDRSNPYLILPTIAVQLARKYPDFRSSLVPLVLSDPGIARGSLFDQMQNFITRPLMESDISTVIIIDALDECKDGELTSVILSAIAQLVPEIPKVKFLITSRPETRIQEGFHLPLLPEATHVFVLHGVEQSQTDNDIRLFLKHKFSEFVHHRHDLVGWPTEGQLGALCERAAGLFVYAVAAVEFITQRTPNPPWRLYLLQSPGITSYERKAKVNRDTTLDPFYASILRVAFGTGDDPDNDFKVRSVLGAMALIANPLSPYKIAKLLGLDIEDVLRPLSSVRSLLVHPENIHGPILPFYKSFNGFIVDPDRCTNRRFHVSPPIHHLQLLMGCLNLMGQSLLEENPCQLPHGVAGVSDIDKLQKMAKQYIDPALQYACGSWHTHLTGGRTTSVDTSGAASAIHRFLKSKFLLWLDVLSVIGAVGNAVDALRTVADWLEESSTESPTLILVNDCFRFVTRYFEVISRSCRHFYHPELALILESSIIWKLCKTKSLTTTINNRNGNNNTPSATSNAPARSRNTEDFVLDFHPVRPLAAMARWKDSTVTIFDLKSGLPHLTVSTGVEVYGLGIAENVIVVVGNGKVVTWNLPEGDRLFNARIETQDSAHSVYLSDDWQSKVVAASISPDLCYIALVIQEFVTRFLYVYSASTGHRVGCVATERNTLWFSPDESALRCAAGTVMKDGWILGPDGKWLLILPPRWRSDAVKFVWRGQYLVFLFDKSPKSVILELEP